MEKTQLPTGDELIVDVGTGFNAYATTMDDKYAIHLPIYDVLDRTRPCTVRALLLQ